MIYFATNRHYDEADNQLLNVYSKDGPYLFRTGTAIVYTSDQGDKIEWTIHPEDKETKTYGSKILFDDLHNLMSAQQKDVVIYIHGFNNTPDDPIKTAQYLMTKLSSKSGPCQFFAFLWPSFGSPVGFADQAKWAYISDRDNAQASGPAMARALYKLLDFLGQMHDENRARCGKRIHLIAHSMGNYALGFALKALTRLTDGARPPVIFDQVFLMAADADHDVLEDGRDLALLPKISRNVNVYYNKHDGVLEISDKTKGNITRLGQYGPKNYSTISSNIATIDVSDLVGGFDDTFGHNYFAQNDAVQKDMIEVLAGKHPDDIPNRKNVMPGRLYRLTP